MKEMSPRQLTWALAALGTLVVVSLSLNGYLLWRSMRTDDRVAEVAGGAALVISQATGLLSGLQEAGPVIDAALDEIDVELTAFQTSQLTFAVDVDQDIPVQTSFPFRRSITIPVRQSLPISETFRTRVEIQGPFGVDIPLDVEIPVDIEVPIEFDVPVELDEQIEIDTTFPLRLSVPVTVDIEGTELARLAARLQQGIAQVRTFVDGLGG